MTMVMHLKCLMHPKISHMGAGMMVCIVMAVTMATARHLTGLALCWRLQSTLMEKSTDILKLHGI